MRKIYRYTVITALVLVIAVQAVLIFVLLKRPAEKIIKHKPLAVNAKATIAIVLDDWGYNQDNFVFLKQIPYPLTLSVLPNLPFSRSAGDYGHSLGKEIMLHLPMEPRENLKLEKNTVMTSMDSKSIEEITSLDLNSIPYVMGVSNHMGSKAVEDKNTILAIFKVIKKRKLFFLDSYVSLKSVCSENALSLRLPFAKRDVFIDNDLDPALIRRQLYKLKIKALKQGSAIGIGHDRKNTLRVLKEVMPEMENEGYKFVFVSQLVR